MGVMVKLVRLMWVPVLLALLYTGGVFWQRHRERSAKAAVRVEPDPLAAYGTAVKILHFYTAAHEIVPGGKALVCYGMVNAVKATLEPPVEKVWPAISRCMELTPATSTRYTLTAEGADHMTVSQSIEIAVEH
jgi:hypothetical protein